MPDRLNFNSDFPIAIKVQVEDDATGQLVDLPGLTGVEVRIALSPHRGPAGSLPAIGDLTVGLVERAGVPAEYFAVFDAAALTADLEALERERVVTVLRIPGDFENEILEEFVVSSWDDAR